MQDVVASLALLDPLQLVVELVVPAWADHQAPLVDQQHPVLPVLPAPYQHPVVLLPVGAVATAPLHSVVV